MVKCIISNEINVYLLFTVDLFSVNAPNLALKKNTTQKSTVGKRGSSLAVDGKRGSMTDRFTCAEQRRRSRPSWEVDLGAMYRVQEVVVTQQFCKRTSCQGK